MKNIKCRYGDDHESANNYKKQALELIEKLEVAPTPVHFTLFYEYASRLEPNLVSEIEDLIRNNYYNEYTARTIFRALIKNTLDHYLPTEEVQQIIKEILNDLNSWSKDTSSVQTSLENDLACLIACKTKEEADDCLRNNILPSVLAIQKNANSLQNKISASSEIIEHLKLELEHATSLAKTDPLTGIYNRRGYDEIIQQQIEYSTRKKRSFAMLMLDIDHFKKINDSYGHLVGDSVLRYIAKLLQAHTKGQDSLARLGGEEFVILLNNISYENAMIFAEKIRRAISDKAFKAKNHKDTLKISVSIGVSLFKSGETADDLFDRADLALYQAKTNGRNQTCGEKELCQSKG